MTCTCDGGGVLCARPLTSARAVAGVRSYRAAVTRYLAARPRGICWWWDLIVGGQTSWPSMDGCQLTNRPSMNLLCSSSGDRPCSRVHRAYWWCPSCRVTDELQIYARVNMAATRRRRTTYSGEDEGLAPAECSRRGNRPRCPPRGIRTSSRFFRACATAR